MPKITSVKPQKKSARGRTKRYNIFLDGEFAFGADEDLVVNRRLVIDKEISPADLEKILFEAQMGKLMERMYRLWNLRPRSEKEVRDYFKVKQLKLSELVIEAVVEALKKKGLINDLEFARSWVESRRKKYGKYKIKQELWQKGIDKEIIEEVISEQVTGDSESQIAIKALEKKLIVWKNLESMELKKKAIQYLMRKGFEYEVIKKTVEKYFKKE